MKPHQKEVWFWIACAIGLGGIPGTVVATNQLAGSAAPLASPFIGTLVVGLVMIVGGAAAALYLWSRPTT